MKILNLTLVGQDGRKQSLEFRVQRLLLAGFTGRNRELAMKHIEELKEHGVAAPDKIPTLYPVQCHLVTTDEEIEVLGNNTSGEVEPVFLFKEGNIYVGVGSDHTDREIEKVSIDQSKVMCPKIIAEGVWDYKEIKEDWERLILRSWVEENGEKKLYQEGSLASFLPPEDLIRLTHQQIRDQSLDGMVLSLGTIPLLGKGFVFSDAFEGELSDKSSKRKLSFSYRVKQMDWLL